MIRCPIQRDARTDQSAQRIGKARARGVQDRHVVQPRRSWRRRRPAFALPRVQPDVMVITSRREKGRLRPVSLRDLKTQDTLIETDRPFQIGDLQMHMSDSNGGIDHGGVWQLRHAWIVCPADGMRMALDIRRRESV